MALPRNSASWKRPAGSGVGWSVNAELHLPQSSAKSYKKKVTVQILEQGEMKTLILMTGKTDVQRSFMNYLRSY